MIEKLTCQLIIMSTVNQCMKNQLKRLKKKVNEKSMMLFESHLVLSVNVVSSVQNHCKKFKIKIFVKEKEKIKRIMMTTTENIVK